MKSLLGLLISIICCFAGYAETVDSYTALQIVKNLQTNNQTKTYYVSHVTSLENDINACEILSQPSEAWTQPGIDKWLVFVDEQPQNKMWAHPCSYYYLPQTVEDLANVPILSFTGHFPPSQTQGFSNQHGIQPSSIIPFEPDTVSGTITYPWHWMPPEIEHNKVYVIIIAGGYNPKTNSIAFYNNTAYLYNTLHQQYNIPKERILTYLGYGFNGQDILVDADHGIYQQVPFDFDGDGECDVRGHNVQYDITQDLINHPEYFDIDNDTHLLVIINTHGGQTIDGKTYIKLSHHSFDSDGQYCYGDTLKSWFDRVPSKTQTFVINSCHGGGLIEDLQSPKSVVMSACRAEESAYGDPCFAFFLHKWTNAIRGLDYYGNPVDADTNGDHEISMAEAFEYAKEANYELPAVDDYDISMEHAQYNSSTTWLGEELTLNYIPGEEDLYIRDNETDAGLHFNSTSNIVWNSPDIWIRNQADGFLHQTHEQPRINGNHKLYVYTRIHNRGHQDCLHDTQKMNLYWAINAIGVDNANLYGDISRSGLFHSEYIHQDIPQDSSFIVETEWELPQNLINLSNQLNGIVPISVLAIISNYNLLSAPHEPLVNTTPGMRASVEYNNHYAIKKLQIARPDDGSLMDDVTENLFSKRKEVKLPILIQKEDTTSILKIKIISSKMTNWTHSAFTRSDIGVILSPSLFTSWEQSGGRGTAIEKDANAPYRIRLLSDSSCIDGLILQKNQVDSILFTIRRNVLVNYLDSISHSFNLCITDADDKIIEGIALCVEIAGKEQGGVTPYPYPVFQSIKKDTSDCVTVTLTSPAKQGTAIAIASTLGIGTVSTIEFPEGNSDASLSTKGIPMGPYVIALLQEGKTIDSKVLAK
ncbi:MAG: hypothetical protein IJ808_04580 [Muribaculaceae bacterium]|nr:hypothetical protein [Muribaculaceae bacterium]